jgi:hypothetical protein
MFESGLGHPKSEQAPGEQRCSGGRLHLVMNGLLNSLRLDSAVRLRCACLGTEGGGFSAKTGLLRYDEMSREKTRNLCCVRLVLLCIGPGH